MKTLIDGLRDFKDFREESWKISSETNCEMALGYAVNDLLKDRSRRHGDRCDSNLHSDDGGRFIESSLDLFTRKDSEEKIRERHRG